MSGAEKSLVALPEPAAHHAYEREAEAAARAREATLDPIDGKRRGVVHTPPELARFVARAVDQALRDHCGCPDGLAERRVSLVDPACGPGAFLAAAFSLAGGRAGVPTSVVGLDIDPAIARGANCHLERAAEEVGFPLDLRVVDALESANAWPADGASEEVRVVVGNPPWASRSFGRGAYSEQLLDDFRCDAEGRRLPEKKIGVLSDDYVRFVRVCAEWVREGPGAGVMGLVTNGSYLDGPVHRGMRGALLRWFDGIDVVDLGGNALVARRRGVASRDGHGSAHGDRDDNVFGVRPSVAVLVAWRDIRAGRCRGERSSRTAASLRYARLFGSKEQKWAQLEQPLPWQTILPQEPHHLFSAGPGSGATTSGGERLGWPESFLSLTDAMPFHAEGVQTNRDAAAVATTPEQLLERLQCFARGESHPDLDAAYRAQRHYRPGLAQQRVRERLAEDPDGQQGRSIRRLAYRPGDTRFFAPIAPFCHRPRPKLLDAMDRSTFALLTVRKDRGSAPWAHAWATRWPVDNCFLSNRSSCRTRAFPTHRPDGSPNLCDRVIERWSHRLGEPLTAHAFATYALAILLSPGYRRLFDRVLHVDYPRLPVPDLPLWSSIKGQNSHKETSFYDSFADQVASDPSSNTPREHIALGHGRFSIESDLAKEMARVDAIITAFVQRSAILR